MKKKLLAVTLASALCAGMLAGCGSSASTGSTGDSGSTASGDAYNVTVIVKHTDGHFNKVIAGARAYGSEHDNVNVEIQSPTSATSYDEQVNMIETALGNPGIDAVVIAPQQSTSTATLVDTATKPVVALDTDFTSDKKACFVGTGNEDAALNGGKAVAEACKALGKDKPTAVIIAGVQGDQTNTARMNGYKAGVEEAGGTFLSDEVQYADATADRATTAMEAIMQTHPEGIAIICANNDDMAMAAARAAQGHDAYKNTIFLGFNGDRAACEAILAGQMTMSVAQMAYEMGYKAVETMVQVLDGETVDEFVDSGSDVVTPDNAQERLDTLKTQLH